MMSQNTQPAKAPEKPRKKRGFFYTVDESGQVWPMKDGSLKERVRIARKLNA